MRSRTVQLVRLLALLAILATAVGQPLPTLASRHAPISVTTVDSAIAPVVPLGADTSPVDPAVIPGTETDGFDAAVLGVDVPVIVRRADLEATSLISATTNQKWFFFDDENNTLNPRLGAFVVGPATPISGTGSIQISTSDSRRPNLATYRFAGTVLSTITDLRYSTYNPSYGNGGSANRSGYLQFNIDFNGSDTWQRRINFVPANNGTVTQNSWKEWDAINGGTAKWGYSGAFWPAPNNAVPGTTTLPWSQILADYPGVRIRISDPFLGIRVGEPYADGYTENIDTFTFGTAGNVFRFDFEPNSATTITSADLEPSSKVNAATNQKWFFYNDENDTIDSSIGGFVTGPGTPLIGTGSAQFSVTGNQRRNLATYRFSGTKLSDISEMTYGTYNPSAGNGGSATRSGYLQFNVSFDGADTWQRRMVYVPVDNAVVTQNTWKIWDTLEGGTALWRYSGPTWPAPNAALSGSTPISWTKIISDYPAAKMRVTDSFLGVRVGEPYNDGYTENIDAFTLATTSAQLFNFEPTPQCTTTCYVDATTGSDGFGGSSPTDAKRTIQAGINTVLSNGQVIVASGTYTQQLSINKSLTLTGAGAATTFIKSPQTIVPNSEAEGVLVDIFNNAVVNMTGFTVAGPKGPPLTCSYDTALDLGIWVRGNANLTITNSNITAIRDEPLSGCQTGIGIYVGGQFASTNGTLTATGLNIAGFQKGAIVVSNSGSSALISGNTITGVGPTPAIAQNGIQVSAGASATIARNVIKDLLCDNPTCSGDFFGKFTPTDYYYQSAGLLLIDNGPVTATQNSLINVDVGVLSQALPSGSSRIESNFFQNSRYAGIALYAGNGGANGSTTVLSNTINGLAQYGIALLSYASDTTNVSASVNGNSIIGAGTAIALLDENASNTSHAALVGVATLNDINRSLTNAIVVSSSVAFGGSFNQNYITPSTGTGSGVVGTTNGSPLASPVVTNRYVSATGTDVGVCTVQLQPCKTLGHGMLASSDGDNVNVAAGSYSELVYVDRGVTFLGAKAGVDARTRATSGESILGSTNGAFAVTFNGVVIDGFTIQGADSTAPLGSAIWLSSANSGTRILNNIVQNNVMGVSLNAEGTRQTVVQKNLFKDNLLPGAAGETDIYGDGLVKNVLIDQNTFSGSETAINVAAVPAAGYAHSNITITGNSVISDGAILLIRVDGAVVSGNTVLTGKYSAFYLDGSTNIVVASNTVSSTGFSAVRVHNQYSGNPNGVITVTNNILSNTGDYGVNVATGSLTGPMTVISNSITANTLGGVNNGSTTNLLASCNWYGNANGPTVASNPGGTGSTVAGPVTFAPWLNSGTDTSASTGFQPAAGTCTNTNQALKLTFTTQPGGATPNVALAPQPIVRVEDNNGNVAVNYNGIVQLSLGSNPTSAVLGGTTAVTIVNGVATFTNISVDRVGTGYTLVAQSGSLPQSISNPFTITAVPASPTPTATSTSTSTPIPVGPQTTPTPTATVKPNTSTFKLNIPIGIKDRQPLLNGTGN